MIVNKQLFSFSQISDHNVSFKFCLWTLLGLELSSIPVLLNSNTFKTLRLLIITSSIFQGQKKRWQFIQIAYRNTNFYASFRRIKRVGYRVEGIIFGVPIIFQQLFKNFSRLTLWRPTCQSWHIKVFLSSNDSAWTAMLKRWKNCLKTCLKNNEDKLCGH